MNPDFTAATGIVIAALGGAAVGLERQRSGHATGPQARFAGVRTFTLLGLLSGMAGWMWTLGLVWLGTVLLAGAAGLVVAAYAAASRRDVEGTTEVAALVVLAAGVLAGTHHRALASGVIAITVLLLVEKSRLHALAERIDEPGMRAAVRFAVMAVVILPLLPPGPYGPWGGFRPQLLWVLVLFFSGLSFLGYVLRRIYGPGRGYAVAGLLGGLVSSTNVTFTFARLSRAEAAYEQPLALGTVAASAVLFLRVLVAVMVLHPPLSFHLLPYIAAPFLLGTLAVAWGYRRATTSTAAAQLKAPSNPLQFASALQMALLFQAVLFGVYLVREKWGEAGLLVSGAVLGLTDMDALTISMARGAAAAEGVRVPLEVAAQAISIGILSNTALKLGLATALGTSRFRRITAAGLALIGVALALSLALLR